MAEPVDVVTALDQHFDCGPAMAKAVLGKVEQFLSPIVQGTASTKTAPVVIGVDSSQSQLRKLPVMAS